MAIGNRKDFWGAWVAQSFKCPTSAWVMILRVMSSNSASGSVLTTAQSLEPASDSVSPPLVFCLSLSLKNKQTLKNVFLNKKIFKKEIGKNLISRNNLIEFLKIIKQTGPYPQRDK